MENINLEKLDKKFELISKLSQILNENIDKRVVVVGTTCTGKTTFLKNIENAHDMDELVFPQLTKEEHDYVCSHPWTPEIGSKMISLTKEKVKIGPGNPVFGTIVLESDLIVYLQISDELLKQRTELRGANFEDAKNMQKQIEEEIIKSNIPVLNFFIG
ncbi:MAG: hypothetical protein WCK59_01170 [Candidatus Falkowbacteria bacterium]